MLIAAAVARATLDVNGSHGHGAHGSRAEEGEGVREGGGVGRLGRPLWRAGARQSGRPRGGSARQWWGVSARMAATSRPRGVL